MAVKSSEFASKLKQHLKGANLTQEKLAERVGCQQSAINNYLRGVAIPRKDRVDELATALALPPTDTRDMHLLAESDRSARKAEKKPLPRSSLVLRKDTDNQYQKLQELLRNTQLSSAFKNSSQAFLNTFIEGCFEIVKDRLENHKQVITDGAIPGPDLRHRIQWASLHLNLYLLTIEARFALRRNQSRLIPGFLSMAHAILEQLKTQYPDVGSINGISDLEAEICLIEGDVLLYQGELGETKYAPEYYTGALGKYYAAQRLYHDSGSVGEGRARRKQAVVFLHKSDFAQAMVCLRSALTLLDGSPDYEERARAFFDTAWCLSAQGQLREAEHYVRRGENIANESQHPYLHMLALSAHGHLYRQRQEWDKCILKFEDALKFSEKLGDEKEKGWILVGLGRAYYHRGIQKNLERDDVKRDEYLGKACQNFILAKKAFQDGNYRYRRALVLALMGKLVFDTFDFQRGQVLPVVQKAMENDDEWKRSGNTRPLSRVMLFYDRSRLMFEQLQCPYYEAKILEYQCELLSIAGISQLSNYQEDFEHYVIWPDPYVVYKAIKVLHEKGSYPQYLAHALADLSIGDIRNGDDLQAADRLARAIYHILVYGSYAVKGIDGKLKRALRFALSEQYSLIGDLALGEIKIEDGKVMRCARLCQSIVHKLTQIWEATWDEEHKGRGSRSKESFTQDINQICSNLTKIAREIEHGRNWSGISLHNRQSDETI